MTEELILELYYQIQDELDLPDDIAIDIALFRTSSNWTLEAEEEMLSDYY